MYTLRRHGDQETQWNKTIAKLASRMDCYVARVGHFTLQGLYLQGKILGSLDSSINRIGLVTRSPITVKFPLNEQGGARAFNVKLGKELGEKGCGLNPGKIQAARERNAFIAVDAIPCQKDEAKIKKFPRRSLAPN